MGLSGRGGGRVGGPGSEPQAHLKSLSLDVIFSSRLAMWKAAVLMVAARRGRPAGGNMAARPALSGPK